MDQASVLFKFNDNYELFFEISNQWNIFCFLKNRACVFFTWKVKRPFLFNQEFKKVHLNAFILINVAFIKNDSSVITHVRDRAIF